MRFRYQAGENKSPHPFVPWGWQEDYTPAISPPGGSTAQAQGVNRLPITRTANYTTWIYIHAYARAQMCGAERHTDWTAWQAGQSPVSLYMNCVCWSLEEQPTNNHKLNSRHSWNISSDWIPQPQGEVLSWTYYLPIRSWLLIFIIINCILLSYIYVWFIVLQLEHNKPVVSFVGLRGKKYFKKSK